MGNLRIAFGTCSFRADPKLNTKTKKICLAMSAELDQLKSDFIQIKKYFVPSINSDEVSKYLTVDGKDYLVTVYRVRLNSKILIVLQIYYRTFRDFNHISLAGLGRIMAEGFLITENDQISEVEDDLLWEFR